MNILLFLLGFVFGFALSFIILFIIFMQKTKKSGIIYRMTDEDGTYYYLELEKRDVLDNKKYATFSVRTRR